MKWINTPYSIRKKALLLDLLFAIIFCVILCPIVLLILDVVEDIFKLDYILYEKIAFLDRIIYGTAYSAYFTFKDFLTKNGSLGNKIMKIKVIDAQTGEKPKNNMLLLRGITSTLTSYFDVLCCLVRKDDLSITDILSKTCVV